MDKPSYFAVLPAEVRYDASLSAFEKILFAEITALTNKEGRCWASNEYFGRLYKKHDKYISEVIRRLAVKGYISVENESLGRYGRERSIYLVRKFLDFMPIKKCTSRSEKPDLEGRNVLSRSEKPDLPLSLSTNFNNTYIAHFEKLWKKHPLKLGKKEALKRYQATVKTEQDRQRIEKAQEKYLKHLALNTWKGPQHGKTWFGAWEEWVDFVESTKTGEGFRSSRNDDEKREQLKAELKEMYKTLRRKQEYLDCCDEGDHRAEGLQKEIAALNVKIQRLEAKLCGNG